MNDLRFDIQISPQPTETTCGPTCLHSIFKYHGEKRSHQKLIDEITYTETGGTLGVNLGINAIKRGFQVDIYSHNLNVFDPTWFKLSKEDMIKKLNAQIQCKAGSRVSDASRHYVEFLKKGGAIKYSELTAEFLYETLQTCGPVICGLSATYLYMSERERNDTCEFDDINGFPQGHFVILSGMSGDLSTVEVSDPLSTNPFSEERKYQVKTQHLINSILIGVITYDANIMSITREKE